jgi:hypothetical protein
MVKKAEKPGAEPEVGLITKLKKELEPVSPDFFRVDLSALQRKATTAELLLSISAFSVRFKTQKGHAIDVGVSGGDLMLRLYGATIQKGTVASRLHSQEKDVHITNQIKTNARTRRLMEAAVKLVARLGLLGAPMIESGASLKAEGSRKKTEEKDMKENNVNDVYGVGNPYDGHTLHIELRPSAEHRRGLVMKNEVIRNQVLCSVNYSSDAASFSVLAAPSLEAIDIKITGATGPYRDQKSPHRKAVMEALLNRLIEKGLPVAEIQVPVRDHKG